MTMHNTLTGLSADDHPQYVLANGSRDITGNQTVNGIVTADGLDIPDGGEIKLNPSGEVTVVKSVASREFNFNGFGTVKIRVGLATSNMTIQTTIRGSSGYGDYQRSAWELHIAAFLRDDQPGWYVHGCSITGDSPFQSVRLGSETINSVRYPVILLGLDGQGEGEDATYWGWPLVEIESVVGGNYYNGADVAGTGPDWTFDNSDDEATDWANLSGVEVCRMYVAPGMEIVDKGDGTVDWKLNGAPLNATGEPHDMTLTANKTIYVRTTGNDSNDGLSANTAFLTPAKAVEESKKYFIGGYQLSIDVGEGTFNCATALSPGSNEGANIAWGGVADAHTSLTINNIDGSASALSAGLEYIDFDVNFAGGSGATVGQFVLVKTTSGGSNPNLVKGCHEIIAYSANVATVRCVRVAGSTTLPSGTITANTLTLVKTVFNFNSGSHGIFVTGEQHAGTWNSMVFKGTLGYSGIWMLGGAAIALGINFGTSKWAANLKSHSNSSIYADGSTHSYGHSYLATAAGGSFMSLISTILSGCWDTGLRAYDCAKIDFRYGQVLCGGTVYNIYALLGGAINARLSAVEGCKPSGSIAYYATSGGTVVATGTSDDAATSYATGAAPGGNGASVCY